jgi:hypothetical protein
MLTIGGREHKIYDYFFLEMAMVIRPRTPILIAPTVEELPSASRKIPKAMTTKTMPTMKRDVFNWEFLIFNLC